MAKSGAEYRHLKNLHAKMERLAKSDDIQRFNEAAVRELAARLLAKVDERTPVGDYDKQIVRDGAGQRVRISRGKNKGQYKRQTVKMGGTLRRGWTVGDVIKTGDVYQIEILNVVYYASYVEYGHRTRGHKGWVEGRFMLTISEKELRQQSPALLQKKLDAFLKGAMK